MKQKIKEIIFSYLIIFCIGGMLGFIYGLFSGTYSYVQGMEAVINALVMFFAGGLLFVIFLAGISIIVVSLQVIFKWLKS